MLKIKRPFKLRIGLKTGPKNVTPVEQKLWFSGYRLFSQKLVSYKSIGWENIYLGKRKKFRVREYIRGSKHITVSDIIVHI